MNRTFTLRAFYNSVVALTIATVLSGCYTAVKCDGGYCGVGYARPADAPRRGPKKIEEVTLSRGRDPLPAGAHALGTFTWSVTIFDVVGSGFNKCPAEIEDFFRGKAANLGFDGVAGVQLVGGAKGGEPKVVIADANGGLYLSHDAMSPTGSSNTLTGATPIAAFGTMPPVGSCIGVPYVIDRAAAK